LGWKNVTEKEFFSNPKEKTGSLKTSTGFQASGHSILGEGIGRMEPSH
jgi:hypothetical protein